MAILDTRTTIIITLVIITIMAITITNIRQQATAWEGYALMTTRMVTVERPEIATYILYHLTGTHRRNYHF
uniref:Putative secreted protein n=1 Tax=Xenopsylla cheopis TaxID=163159 RepID=A0A6M2DWH2_XENCH